MRAGKKRALDLSLHAGEPPLGVGWVAGVPILDDPTPTHARTPFDLLLIPLRAHLAIGRSLMRAPPGCSKYTGAAWDYAWWAPRWLIDVSALYARETHTSPGFIRAYRYAVQSMEENADFVLAFDTMRLTLKTNAKLRGWLMLMTKDCYQ